MALAKDGGDWKLSKPVQRTADFGSVEGLVGRLQTVQMKSIVADNASPADLKKYGLDKPEATVNLEPRQRHARRCCSAARRPTAPSTRATRRSRSSSRSKARCSTT